MIAVCPECGDAAVRLARQGGKTEKEDRIYHCPRCNAVFNHSDLQLNWPRKDTRPNLEIVVSFGGWLKIKEIGPVSEDYI